MTKISLKKDSVFGFGGFTVCGHSGYADEGSDIVCAYISSACELILNIIVDELCSDVKTNIVSENAFIELEIMQTEKNMLNAKLISSVMRGFSRQMKEFSKQFPKFVSISFA